MHQHANHVHFWALLAMWTCLRGGHTRTRVSTFSLIAANACRNGKVGVRSRSASTARERQIVGVAARRPRT